MKRNPDWVRLVGRGLWAVLDLVLRLAAKAKGVNMADVRRTPAKRGAPATYQARWRISYVDTDGVITDRVVRVRRVDHRSQKLYAWCETRQGLRTFKLAGVRSAQDASTGRTVNPMTWAP